MMIWLWWYDYDNMINQMTVRNDIKDQTIKSLFSDIKAELGKIDRENILETFQIHHN